MGLEEDILSKYKTVAVVGLSSNPERPSHRVARYLKEQGYRIIPVNPRETEVLGERPTQTCAPWRSPSRWWTSSGRRRRCREW